MKTTLVIGASENPERYSYKAIQSLKMYGHTVIAIGNKKGEIFNTPIQTEINEIQSDDLDTITLYISPKYQAAYQDWIIAHKPRRVIFNPGTENESFEALLASQGISTLEACTLVLLSTGQY